MNKPNRSSETYHQERKRMLAKIRRAGRTLEEAEDLLHDVWAEAMEKASIVDTVTNLGAWIQHLLGRRLIDLWRRERMQERTGGQRVSDSAIEEIIAATGLNPLDNYVRETLLEALDSAMKALPPEQRAVIEAQVFGEKTFRELSEAWGISQDTLAARKRYAINNLARMLRHWVEDI